MTLPSSIRIGFRDYQVVELPWQDSDSQERFGDCDTNHSIIRVAMHYGAVRAAHTLLHEVLHGAWDAARLSPREQEEGAVTGLADILAGVWRDNPEFVRFLSESLGGKVE